MNITQVHDLCDQIEKEIELRLKHVHVMVHAEPCEEEDCPQCQADCEQRYVKNN